MNSIIRYHLYPLMLQIAINIKHCDKLLFISFVWTNTVNNNWCHW